MNKFDRLFNSLSHRKGCPYIHHRLISSDNEIAIKENLINEHRKNEVVYLDYFLFFIYDFKSQKFYAEHNNIKIPISIYELLLLSEFADNHYNLTNMDGWNKRVVMRGQEILKKLNIDSCSIWFDIYSEKEQYKK